MNIHVICPFCRVWLIPTLIHYLEPMGIQWYPVVAPKEDVDFGPHEWIHPTRTHELEFDKDFCWRKVNDWLDIWGGYINDNDYYCFMGDDDMYEPGFFEVVRQQTAKILVVSASLGDSKPQVPDEKMVALRESIGETRNIEQHPPGYLYVRSLADIRVCNTGFGQYILKGEIFKQTRFRNKHKWDDGRYGEMLKRRWPEHIKVLPNLFMFGNFLQPGRYTTKDAFLKPNWELPRII